MGGTNQICNIGGKVVNDIKTNLTALEISVSKVVESTPKTQPQTKHEKNHIFEKKNHVILRDRLRLGRHYPCRIISPIMIRSSQLDT